MNQKNPPQVLRNEMRADSVPVDEHYSTEGYFYDNPILTRTGIFKYKLEDGSERRELRRPEDVFDPASLASWYNVIDEIKKLFHHRRLYGCAGSRNIVTLKYKLGLKVAKLLAWFPFRNY